MTPGQSELKRLHDTVAGIPCSRCEAPIGKRCANPVTGRPSRVPCLVRIQQSAPFNDESAVPLPPSDLDTSGDQWVHAGLSIRPQTVARLATDLDATGSTIEASLSRLEMAGQAQRHCWLGEPDNWSLRPSSGDVERRSDAA